MRASEISAQDVAVDAVAPTVARLNVILRDIARSGLAGLLTGVLVAGIGGRIVMRLAAVLEPGAVGQFTESGNRIGTISAGGSGGEPAPTWLMALGRLALLVAIWIGANDLASNVTRALGVAGGTR